MKRNNSLFIVFVAFVAFAGCAKREITNIDSQGRNIICFGDSITAGEGVGASQSYPSLLASMLNLPVINVGVNGDTSAEALKRLESDVLDKDPLLVIVEFGGNDFLRRISFDETLRNTEDIIKRLHSAGAMVALTDVSSGMIMNGYKKEFRRLSKKYNTIFVPHLLSGILVNSSLKSDSIHPNADGYKLIAQRIHRAIMPYLNQNTVLRQSQK